MSAPRLRVDAPLEKLHRLRDLRAELGRLDEAKLERWRNDPVAWIEERLGESAWSKQSELLLSVVQNKLTAVQSSHGTGKALYTGTMLPTPDGWTTMANVQVGEQLLDENGKAVTVLAKSPVQYRPTYRVRFDDRTELVASDDHQWQVLDLRHRAEARRIGCADWRDHWAQTVTKTTVELAAELCTPGGQLRWRIPTARPIEGAPVAMPIGPYTLGLWLGDGTSDQAAFICANDDAPELLAALDAEGTRWRVRKSALRERCTSYGLLGILPALRELNVFRNKHIPRRVFRANVETRLEVLRGLMDTDGFVADGQSVGIDLCNAQLAADTAELVRTFGWKARTTTKPSTYYGRVVGTVYRLNFRPDMQMFKLARKANQLGKPTAQKSRHTQRTIVGIEQIDTHPTQCVTVDSPSHLYLAGESLVPTHNSHSVSRLVGYYLDNYPPGDFFVVTTAPTWPQVRAIIWRYIGQMAAAHQLPGYVTQNAEWKIGNELVAFGRKPSDHNQQGMQGQHGRRGVIAIIDEASGVPEQIWNAVDSMATTPESRIVAVGNPDSISSRFHKVCTTEPGWNRIKISSFDTPAFTGEQVPEDVARGLVQREWVEDKARRWGVDSPLYRIKVLGEFSDSEDGLIPLSWVQAANQRWLEWKDQFDGVHEPAGRKIFGVDVARYGDDKTAIAERQGDVVFGVETFSKLDTTQTTGLVQARLRGTVQGRAVVDVVGVGAGVVDQLRRAGCDVRAFNGASKTTRKDSSGSWKFPNLRVASWYHLRELLDPALGASLCLPPDDDLAADLTAPTYEPRAGGFLWVEDKASVRKRLGHSPDLGDSVAMACWTDAFPRADDADLKPLKPITYTNRGGSWA